MGLDCFMVALTYLGGDFTVGVGFTRKIGFLVAAGFLIMTRAGGSFLFADWIAISEQPINSSCGPNPRPQEPPSHPQLLPEIL